MRKAGDGGTAGCSSGAAGGQIGAALGNQEIARWVMKLSEEEDCFAALAVGHLGSPFSSSCNDDRFWGGFAVC